MPSLPELQSEAMKWQRRITMVSGAGLNPQPVQELAKTDLTRLIQGGSPLPEDQIITMVHSAYTGQVATSQTQAGPDFNPLHVVGHIAQDLTTDVRSFIPGLAHTAADIATPSKDVQAISGGEKALGELATGNIHQAALDIRATPIIGGLIPGTFALTGGWKGLTQHPLNMFLDVLPYVSAGSKLATIGAAEAEAGSYMAALKEGHPLEAVARATGIEQKIMDLAQKGALSKIAQEYTHMPVWRAYNELARVYSRRLVQEELGGLQRMGLLSKHLSQEESQKIMIDAQTYDQRLTTKPVQLTPDVVAQIKNAGPDLTTAFKDIPPGMDMQVWAVGGDLSVGPALSDQLPIYFTKEEAIKSVPNDPQAVADLVHEARVSPHDVSFNQGQHFAKDVRENRYYSPEYAKRLQDIRSYTDSHGHITTRDRASLLPGKADIKAPKVLVVNPATGKPEIFQRDSKVFKAQHTYQSANGKFIANQHLIEANDAKIAELQNQAAGRVVRYPAFGESAADAAKRAPTVPSIGNMYNAAHEFITQGMGRNTRGLYEQLNRAFQTGRPRDVARTLRNIIAKEPAGSPEQAYARTLLAETAGLGKRSIDATVKMGELIRAQARGRELQFKAERLGAVADRTREAFYQELSSSPPERFYPLISREVRGKLVQQETAKMLEGAKARTVQQGAGIAEAIGELHHEYQRLVTDIQGAKTREELAGVVGADTLQRVETQAFQDWGQMIQAGYDPIWLHEINPQHYHNQTFGLVQPLAEREFKPSDFQKRVFNYKPQVLDIQAALTEQAVEYMQFQATRQYIDFLVHKSGSVIKEQVARQDLEARGFSPTEIEAELRNKYVPFSPHAFVPTWSKAGDTFLMQRDVHNGFERLMEGDRIPFKGLRDPVHRVFKVAVLTGPRHMVHVTVGGLVMMALQEPGAILDLLAQPVQMFKMAREGTGLTDHVYNQLSKGNYEERVDQIIGYRGGKKYGEWWRQSQIAKGLHTAEEGVNKLENTITDMYRSATYLHELKNGANSEAALAHVNKIFIDVDNLTPFERTTLRQIFPFWTFTKHILRYVLTYPADHPLRASILANLAHMIEADNTSGDPARLAKLFMLGQPDATGKIKTVDFSNFNPFRSTASMFSMAGFLAGAAPEIQAGARMFGINPLTGAPSLHQNFSYDSYTGTNRAARPPLNPFDFASAFIPQVNILDHYLLLTDTMRSLKKNNPEAYQRSLFQEMNLPFAVAPINIYDIRAKAAASQFRDAQQSVTDAMKTGNTSGIRKYEAVPFQGQLYDANQVANYIDNFDKIFPGLAPRAVVPKPKTRRKRVL